MMNPMHRHPPKRISRGFTLIELMVGISLGVVVMGGLLAVYIPTIKSWTANASLAQIHDTESVLHDIFGTSIRQAGLLACGSNSRVIDGVGLSSADLGATTNWAFRSGSNFLQASFKAFAANADVTGLLAKKVQDKRLKNNISTGNTVGDAFFVLTPSEGFYRVISHDANNDAKTLRVSSSVNSDINFGAGAFFIVNDCDNPVIFRSSSASSKDADGLTEIKYTNTQLNTYPHPTNTVVNVFEPAIYYLRAKDDIPTLYKATISSTTPLQLIHTPILTGVENMRLEYGIADSNGDYVEKYETIAGPSGTGNSATASLDNVLSVRISVMMQAPGANTAQTNIGFPNLKGVVRYCYKSGESTKDGFKDACPDFMTSTEGRQKIHKVIQFTFILPRIISI